jgi:hypothetical protein
MTTAMTTTSTMKAPSSADLARHSTAIDRAADEYRRARAALFDANGRPLYVPEELARREAALRAELRSVLDAANGAVTAATEAVAAERAREHDLVAGLTAGELERAAARRPFIQDDVERLPAARFVERCRTALESGSRVEMVLHHREAARLLDQWRQAAREGRPVAGGDQLEPLREVVAALEERLVDGTRRQAADATDTAAGTLAVQAGRVYWELLDGGAQYARQAEQATRRYA